MASRLFSPASALIKLIIKTEKTDPVTCLQAIQFFVQKYQHHQFVKQGADWVPVKPEQCNIGQSPSYCTQTKDGK